MAQAIEHTDHAENLGLAEKRRFWVEKTIVRNRPDRESGEHSLGKALWSPKTSKDNKDIYRQMREVSRGDIVFHLVDNESLHSYSVVKSPADHEFIGLPGTDWQNRSGYRVELIDNTAISPPIHRDEFLKCPEYTEKLNSLLNSPYGLFYNKNLELNQGSYLTEAPLELVQIWNDIQIKKTGKHISETWNIPPLNRAHEHIKNNFNFSSIREFCDKLKLAGYHGDEQHVTRLLASSLAKPFILITGNSGTGKTQLVGLFTSWLDTIQRRLLEIIPVGADWTDNRNVLGFVNHLRCSSEGTPAYESPPILELILRAKNDPDRPYFLVLDEMNLSHVERYFADFLSAMESGRPIPLHTSAAELISSSGTKIPPTVELPDNLFITGTVNVDETTYMFSPKVLDRANVIEFRVTAQDAAAFLNEGAGGLGEIASAPAGTAEAFLALARKARKKPVPQLVFHTDQILSDKRKDLGDALTAIFGIMQGHRMEFGYRTIHEVLRYAGVDYELAADRDKWSWEACLDVQILQKILPKLHGSKKRIEQLLVDLAVFCETGAAPAGSGSFTARFTGKITYPQSYEKLACMIETVRRDQFVSFI